MEHQDVSRRDLSILYVSVLVSRVGFGVIIIIFPSYIVKSPDLTVAAALALYPLLEAATALPMGRLCDSRGRKGIFIASMGVMAVLMATIGLSRNIYYVGTVHALMGIGAAGVTVSTLTMVTDLTGKRNRGAGMGTFDFMNVGGYATGLGIGGRLEAAFRSDLSLAFYVTSALVACAFLVAVILLKEPLHEPRGPEAGLNPLKSLDSRAKAIIPLWIGVTVLLGIVFFLPKAFAGVGVSGSLTSELLLAGVLGLGVGAVGFGALSDVLGRMKVLLIGVGGLFGLLATLEVSLPGGFPGLVRSLPLLGLFGLASSALVPTILATVGDRAMHGSRGSAMGLYSVMLSGGTGIGTLVAGAAHRTAGLTGIFEAAIVVFAIACSVSGVMWVRASRRPEPTSDSSPDPTA